MSLPAHFSSVYARIPSIWWYVTNTSSHENKLSHRPKAVWKEYTQDMSEKKTTTSSRHKRIRTGLNTHRTFGRRTIAVYVEPIVRNGHWKLKQRAIDYLTFRCWALATDYCLYSLWRFINRGLLSKTHCCRRHQRSLPPKIMSSYLKTTTNTPAQWNREQFFCVSIDVLLYVKHYWLYGY